MNDILELINNANNIAILSHIDEDADAFGSSLAMKEMLKNKGKNAVYFLSKPIEHRLQFLSTDYIVYNEAESYGDFDLVICLDCGDEKRLGKRIAIFEKAIKTINIDHHYTNNSFAEINRVDGNMSSTGEMIYDLLTEMGEEITKPIAEFLYCAISSDTGCFKYSCASPKTLVVVSELMKKGIDHAELSRKIFDTETIGALRLKGKVMNSIEQYYDGRLSLVTLDEAVFGEYSVVESDVGDVVNIPRSVEGTEISVSLRKTEGKVKVSLRSNGRYNVGAIALRLGGGGHEMAAGASLGDIELDEAKEKVIKIIGEVING